MSTLNLDLTLNNAAANLVAQLQTPGSVAKHAIIRNLLNLEEQTFAGGGHRVSGDNRPAIRIDVMDNAVAASGAFTFTAQPSADDTFIINGVTFTYKASGATGNQINIAGTLALTLAATVVVVNASATALISNYITSSASATVLTITATRKGLEGNTMTIAEGVDSGSVFSASGARLTGGAVDTGRVTLSF